MLTVSRKEDSFEIFVEKVCGKMPKRHNTNCCVFGCNFKKVTEYRPYVRLLSFSKGKDSE